MTTMMRDRINAGGGATPEPTGRFPVDRLQALSGLSWRELQTILRSAGIDSDLTSVDAVQDMFPGVGGMVILVREEDAEPARRLIQEYRRSPDADETSEIDINEDTPTAG